MNIDVRNIGGGIKRVTAATNEWLPNHVVDNIARDVIETEREFDRFGNRVVFDRWGNRVRVDRWGRAIPVGIARPFGEFDRFGRPITVSVDRPLPLGIGRGINLAEFDRFGRPLPVFDEEIPVWGF